MIEDCESVARDLTKQGFAANTAVGDHLIDASTETSEAGRVELMQEEARNIIAAAEQFLRRTGATTPTDERDALAQRYARLRLVMIESHKAMKNELERGVS